MGIAKETKSRRLSTTGLRKSITQNTITMLRLIGAFCDPVYLVTSSGKVLCSNRSARTEYGDSPPWLDAALRGDERFAKLCPLALDDREVYLVIPTPSDAEDACHDMLDELPPSLQRVARLLLLGLSDKEVVEYTGLSHSSVRTYASRIYQRLGVAGRSELLAQALNPDGSRGR